MRISAVILENFRSYHSRTRIPLEDLTAFVGRNDSGKSTVLEALAIFFDGDLIKFERGDKCVHSTAEEVRVGCAFADLPPEVVLDEKVATTLRDEHLLNAEGELEIHLVFDCGLKNPKGKPHAIALHPGKKGLSDLLTLKISDLKARAKELGVDLSGVDQRVSSAIRNAIWASQDDLEPSESGISLEKEDGKRIWEVLKKQLPIYALFQSDRPSKDQDPEVQDPMKLAVRSALKGVEKELERIKNQVRDHATEVAKRTLEKLQEMDPDLARKLRPDFSAEPKWDSLFKLALSGDDGIPINKRGSGVRRLILLNFFRAEAERRRLETGAPSVILAIEEPETSQHPDNQVALIGALRDLGETEGVQVLITTHVPALAGILPVDSLRYVTEDGHGKTVVRHGSPEVFKEVAQSLGVLPDPNEHVQILLYVEGVNDIEFLTRLSRTLVADGEPVPDLSVEHRAAFIPTGGSSLKAWVQSDYLKGLGRPGVHLYDRDDPQTPPYEQAVEEINGRGDGSFAKLTEKRELENYLHVDAITAAYAEGGVHVALGLIDDWSDVPEMVAEAAHEVSDSPVDWQDLADEKKGKKVSQAKKRLNRDAVDQLTCDQLRARGGFDELRDWLLEVSSRIQ